MATRLEQRCSANNMSSMYLLVCKGRSNDDVGVSRGTVLRGVRPGAGFKTGDFVRENLGGLSLVEAFMVTPTGTGA